MAAVTITFLGGPDSGNVDHTVWGNAATGAVTFPLRIPVTVDPDASTNAPERAFLAHLIVKARTNPFFKVEDGGTAEPAKVGHVAQVLDIAPKRRGRPPKASASPEAA